MTITHYQNWLRPHHRHFFVDHQDANSWTPRVDVREEDTRYVILADIPGVDSKDIEISMDKSVLTIKGERKSETIAENAKVTRVERRQGASSAALRCRTAPMRTRSRPAARTAFSRSRSRRRRRRRRARSW